MLELIFEGYESALLACSLVLLVPGAATAIAARQESSPALAGYGVGALAISWLRFSNRLDDLPGPLIALGFVVAVILLLVPLLRRLDLVSAAGGLAAGGAGAALWTPCVGEQFGTLLRELPTRGPDGVLLLGLYLFGVLAPLVLLGAGLHLIPASALLPARPFMMVLGGGVLGLLALTVAAGLDDELVSRLVAWSIAPSS